MNLNAYAEFVEADRTGKKVAATTAIHAFISSFESINEKRAWVTEFLKTFSLGDKIRHELYADVVFPVLLQSYRNSDVWSIEWLAATSQNLYRARNLWAQVDFVTEQDLLKRWRTLAPESGQARDSLLKKMIEQFEYSEHEWPAGILHGMNGANIEECREIADAIAEARQLDAEGKYASYLAEFQEKLNVYMQRIR